jgi:beta-1,4-mannosyltransferase
MRAAVIALGPDGRARMARYARALAATGDVHLIGPLSARLPFVATPRLFTHRLAETSAMSRRLWLRRRANADPRAGTLWQGVRLLWTLLRLPRPDVVVVQIPPAGSALAAACLTARLRGARLILDWHNLAHSAPAVTLGDAHRRVKALRRSERRWAKRAHANVAASQALADWLARELRVHASVVLDRPDAGVVSAGEAERMAAREEIGRAVSLEVSEAPLVVAPVRWSPGEDLDLLIEALERAERRLSAGSGPEASGGGADAVRAPSRGPGPALAVLLIGRRGPSPADFMRRIARRQWAAVAVRTVELEPGNFARAMAAADLGLCLHQSTSGLDLPSTLADFRGAGVPVAIYDYAPVVGEAITDGREGVVFRDAGELASLLVGLASPPTDPGSALARARRWLSDHPAERWDDVWARSAEPVVLGR